MKKIFCVGDCSTSGLEHIDDKVNYTKFLGKLVEKKYEVINNSRTMLTVENIAKNYNLFIPKERTKGNIVCVWIGSNDLYLSHKPEKVFENLNNYCNYLIKNGLNVIVLTLFPRTYTPYFDEATYYKNRKIYNNLIVNNFENVVNIARSSRLGMKLLNEKYCFIHETLGVGKSLAEGHLNTAGHKIVADMIYKKMHKIGFL